jgi:hypothetical protein
MSKIPTSMAHLVGRGKMEGELVPWDYPMLSMVLVNLQNDQTRGAADYAEVTSIPAYMKHMVGNVQICAKDKTVVVGGEVRRARAPAQWVLYPLLSDQEKVTVKGGKKYVKRQVSGYMERYFGTGPVVETKKTSKKSAPKHKTRMRFIDEEEEYLRI